MSNRHIGSDLDDFLADEGLLEEVVAVAEKRVNAWQIEQELQAIVTDDCHVSHKMGKFVF